MKAAEVVCGWSLGFWEAMGFGELVSFKGPKVGVMSECLIFMFRAQLA